MIEDDWGGYCDEDAAHTIVDSVNFLDILEFYGIEYYKAGPDKFKVRCPFPFHLEGNERTPSLNIAVDSNVFKCFGCNYGGSIIEFVMYFRSSSKSEAIKEIMGITGMSDTDVEHIEIVRKDPSETVLPHVFKAGVLIRDTIASLPREERPQWEEKAKRWFKTLDYFMLELDDDDWTVVDKFYNKLQNFVERNTKKRD